MESISHMDVKSVWGNSNYQFVVSGSIGNSGGILCVWEETIFKKFDVSISDNFIALYGIWLLADSKILIVMIYAPHSFSLKRILWDYISGVITRWNGETIVLGDFNEVRSEDERFGSIFHQSYAREFNHFISSSGLLEVKMEGYSFTWFYSSDSMVFDELLAKRMDLSRKLHDLKQMELKDAAQKAKVNWAIKGDENSKFFHGVINKRRSQLAIRGVFVNGDWYTDPSMVKEDISIDEIRKAVWDCGESKSPGPDGFTFEFFRRYWHFIGPDFCTAVNCFFDKGRFPRGSNSSFIALIPKVMDAKFVTDFCPISLIGSVYKVVTKILANRLTMVISGLISNTQSAFIANKHIFNGPFILNKVLAWCKRRRKQAFVFKVDFAKAYDLVRWDFLLDVLLAFGFSPKWCQWIRGDPLAPFLFILVMESLHLSITRAVNDGIFKGLRITGSSSLSHLFYADDAVFIGEWSIENLDNLLKILNCFHLALGLCINVNKSHVLGVGVPLDIVRQ
nr:RNA-directed DNA polymerase, eukaryota [Tanacetum cinerariifolium]